MPAPSPPCPGRAIGLLTLLLLAMSQLAAGAARPSYRSILDFDAVPSEDTRLAARANSRALKAALLHANGTAAAGEGGEVLIPAGIVLYLSGVTVQGLVGVTLRVEGTLRFSDDMTLYAVDGGDKRYPMFYFIDCDDITLNGAGVIDGQVRINTDVLCAIGT
jgi:polygalacturonase